MKTLALILVLVSGCATNHEQDTEPTEQEIEQSVLRINQSRHILFGDKLYQENEQETDKTQ
jgi:hypothetical protein